ncbi:MAG: Gfo/Idh/MocA family protein, partial [Bryobacteraceae bacterium]
MRVGLIGTGAIANKHAQAYKNIGFELVACSNRTAERGKQFAEQWGATFVPDVRELCRYQGLDFIDVCTFPDSHLEPVRVCAEIKRPIQVQKPMATNLDTAKQMIDLAR